MNNDVMIEILLHLPLRSLLRFRAVCKFWRDVIYCPRFRKLHTQRHNDDDKADAVYLKFTFLRNCKLSIKLLDNGQSLKSHDFPGFWSPIERVAGAVKGLICISSFLFKDFIAVCNPFIGELKILPSSSSSSHSCRLASQDVGIGFHGDYKVVQLMFCREHHCLHAQLYSRRTDSWRELAGDDGVLDKEWVIVGPIKSLCKNGSFCHWEARRASNLREKIILSFDMKNEVFRKIAIAGEVHKYILLLKMIEIFAKDEYSFLLFVLDHGMMKVYESRCQGSEHIWIHVMNKELPIWIWSRYDFEVFKNCDCVVLKKFFAENGVILYDYRARKFIRSFELPEGSETVKYEELLEASETVEYEGGLITP